MRELCGLHAHVFVCGQNARACNQCLGVVNFSERAIAKEEPRIDRKLQEANVDRSKGDNKLQASRLRWQKLSEQLQIR